MPEEELFLGVDGGNSKTLAVVGDRSGKVQGIGRAGCGNHQAFGLEAAMQEIRRSIAKALQMAGAEQTGLTASFFALAGADLPEDFDMLRRAIDELGLPSPCDLSNDTIAALRAGTDNPNAVVVVLGAGTNAAGRNSAGDEICLPGLGWISGDWGGGGELGREAIWATARAWDGRGRSTMLEELVLRAFDVKDGGELIHRLYSSRGRNDAEVERAITHDLARAVIAAAEAGDAVAAELVVRSGEEVGTTATTLLRRLGLLSCPADVILAGGIFRTPHSLLRDTIEARLSQSAPQARVVLPELEPVMGALFCAMDLKGMRVDDPTRKRAAEGYRRMMESVPPHPPAPPLRESGPGGEGDVGGK
jgi:N-acetylglucosamine kinase-like BadF-type ATPase